jgi:hypothetical protein
MTVIAKETGGYIRLFLVIYNIGSIRDKREGDFGIYS